jgi:heptosyltransferase-2
MRDLHGNNRNHRTLVVRLHSLGDVVLSSRTVELLSMNSEVHFITREEYTPVVDIMPGNPIAVPLLENEGFVAIRRHYKRISPDLLIDLQGNLTSILGLWPHSVRRLVTHRGARRRLLAGKGGEMPLRAAEYIRTAGLESFAPSPVLSEKPSPADHRPTAGLVTGGKWHSKSIPSGVLEETARLLVDRLGFEITLIGNERDISEKMSISIDRRGVRVAVPGGVDSLIREIEFLDILISPDSGPAHLARALGIPVLVVFTTTSPSLGFWEPDYRGVFQGRELSCRPCHRHGGNRCRQGELLCRKLMVPLELFEAAERLLTT